MMKTAKAIILSGLCAAILACDPAGKKESEAVSNADPLPSWNDGPVKKAIISYVSEVTTEGNAGYIPPADRIATFDNDGTLWAEQPVIQGLFAFAIAKQMAEKDPALKNKQPFKAIITGDQQYLHSMSMDDLARLILITHTHISEDQFEKEAAAFFKTARHPGMGVPVAQLVYQPQVELLQYLRSKGFKTYICSGGTVEFMRAVSQEYYGVPPEQVIGSSFKYKYVDSINGIMREPGFNAIDDKQEKPVNIQYHIGRRPVFACGNERSGGDIYMLRYSQGSPHPSFQLLVNHDDGGREFAYQEPDSISLKWAARYQWQVVSMKSDWKTVFAK